MDKNTFQQFAEKIKGETEQADYKHDDSISIPIVRILQDKTQNPPENATPGMFYSPTAGFFHLTSELRVTILDIVNIRQVWTPWTAKDKHILCKCFDQRHGKGVVFVEEEGRWVPGEEERDCSACPHNNFRNRALEPIEPLDYNGKPLTLDETCASGKLFAGILLPDGDEAVTLENVIPFYFQFGSTIFGNSYTRLPNSWEAFTVGCKTVKPEIPWLACKLLMQTAKVDTANGPVYAPTFTLIGVHAGMLEKVRAIAGAYEQRLALKSADGQPAIAPEAPGA